MNREPTIEPSSPQVVFFYFRKSYCSIADCSCQTYLSLFGDVWSLLMCSIKVCLQLMKFDQSYSACIHGNADHATLWTSQSAVIRSLSDIDPLCFIQTQEVNTLAPDRVAQRFNVSVKQSCLCEYQMSWTMSEQRQRWESMLSGGPHSWLSPEQTDKMSGDKFWASPRPAILTAGTIASVWFGHYERSLKVKIKQLNRPLGVGCSMGHISCRPNLKLAGVASSSHTGECLRSHFF